MRRADKGQPCWAGGAAGSNFQVFVSRCVAYAAYQGGPIRCTGTCNAQPVRSSSYASVWGRHLTCAPG